MVSIVIPLFNRIDLFPETVASVLDQDYDNWEVVIVDDGSTDGSYEYALQLAQNDRRFKVLQADQDKKGASAARNVGIEKAGGEYLIFLDSDDLLASFCLRQRVAAMQAHHDLDFAVFNQETFTAGNTHDKVLFNRLPKGRDDDYLKMFLRNENPWSVTCPIWKKSSFLQLKGFDEQLMYMEDPDLHARAIMAGFSFQVFSNSPVDTYYRVGNMDSTKANVFYTYSIKSRIAFLEKMTTALAAQGLSGKIYFTAIKTGYKNLLKFFMLARIGSFRSDFHSITRFLKSAKVLNWFEYGKYLLIGGVFKSNKKLIRLFKLKGFAFRFV